MAGKRRPTSSGKLDHAARHGVPGHGSRGETVDEPPPTSGNGYAAYSQFAVGTDHNRDPCIAESSRPPRAFQQLLRLVGVSPGPTIRKAARDDRSAEALPCHAPRGDPRPA
jgi:hypothetical protein